MRARAGVTPLMLGLMAWGLLLLPRQVQARDPMAAPRQEIQRRLITPQDGAALGEALVGFFRDVISPVDGTRCDMYPTCSQYGVEAARRHGGVLGILLFVDRLFHEWSEAGRAPAVWVHGRQRFWDPLDSNDFWLRRVPEPQPNALAAH